MKPEIVSLDSAAAKSNSGDKVIAPEFRFSAVGFSFRAVVLVDGGCRIPSTRS
jgi:hypothetical protein